jgi:uncharacterized membrane protein YhdT
MVQVRVPLCRLLIIAFFFFFYLRPRDMGLAGKPAQRPSVCYYSAIMYILYAYLGLKASFCARSLPFLELMSSKILSGQHIGM